MSDGEYKRFARLSVLKATLENKSILHKPLWWRLLPVIIRGGIR